MRRAACVLLLDAGSLNAELPTAGHGFPACRRIKKRADFEQLLHTPSLANKWFSVYVRNNEYGFARLGVIASKRIMPTAIARNYAKRMIREGFRCNFSVNYPVDIVVRVRRAIKPRVPEQQLALVDLFRSVHK